MILNYFLEKHWFHLYSMFGVTIMLANFKRKLQFSFGYWTVACCENIEVWDKHDKEVCFRHPVLRSHVTKWWHGLLTQEVPDNVQDTSVSDNVPSKSIVISSQTHQVKFMTLGEIKEGGNILFQSSCTTPLCYHEIVGVEKNTRRVWWKMCLSK